MHAGPYTLESGVTATVWAPLECRPLPSARSGQSPDEFPRLVKHVQTGDTERTYRESLGPYDIIVGSGSQFNRRGEVCQVFLITGPVDQYRFVVYGGEYFVYTDVSSESERERLLQEQGVGRAEDFGGCAGRITVWRVPDS
jgi:hypothetical protein